MPREITALHKKVLKENKVKGSDCVLVIRESFTEETEIRIISRCSPGKG